MKLGDRHSRLRRALSALLVLIAFAILFRTLALEFQRLLEQFRNIEWGKVSLAVLPAIAMLMTTASTFERLAHTTPVRREESIRVILMYLLSQPLKYLPGRVWAMLYQARQMAHTIGTPAAIAASLTHMVLSLCGCLLVYGLAMGRSPWLLLAGVLAIALWLHHGGIARYWSRSEPCKKVHPAQISAIALLILMEWFWYLIACNLFINFPDQSWHSVVTVGAIYAVAWLIGSLVAIVPGGLIVREGAFVTMASAATSMSADQVLMFAGVARLVFSCAEAVSAAAAWQILWRNNKLEPL